MPDEVLSVLLTLSSLVIITGRLVISSIRNRHISADPHSPLPEILNVIQSGPSGCGLAYVDINFKIQFAMAFQRMPLQIPV